MKTIEQIFEFIKKQEVALIGSVDGDGFPNMKAMFKPRKIEGNELYFSTNTSSMRVQQFLQNPKACVYFFKKKALNCEGVMLIGTVDVLQGEEIKKEIWRVGDHLYYRKGVTDPDYCVLKFTAVKGRHYSNLDTISFTLDK